MAKAKRTHPKGNKTRKIKVHASNRGVHPAKKVVSHRMSDRTKARRANARKETKLKALKLEQQPKFSSNTISHFTPVGAKIN